MGNVASTELPPQGGSEAAAAESPSALVVVGPSGVGKGTLIDKLREGNDKYGFSCSHTTRKPREGEEVGVAGGSGSIPAPPPAQSSLLASAASLPSPLPRRRTTITPDPSSPAGRRALPLHH